MKNIISSLILIFLTLITMTSLFSNKPVWSETIREPAYAGSFYQADKDDLLRMIEDLTKKARQTSFGIPQGKTLKALILPHAGYIYSGFTAAHAYHVLRENQFENVILMGPDHRVGFEGISITNADSYKTPLGRIAISEKSKSLPKNSDLFTNVAMSDQQEHSLEVILPFLQYYLKNFKLIPLVMGDLNIKQAAMSIEKSIDDKTLLVASSDLSHYLPYQDAVNTDKDTINMILGLDYNGFLQKERRACGKMPILVLIDLAKKYG